MEITKILAEGEQGTGIVPLSLLCFEGERYLSPVHS
ncbi:hypothetical protein EVA_21292 [gut metagenome]|uniref:Uncharacterized protein n=1 Tax=gut metagenome TaxID=749906 RepID=J9BST4_9ZZZZ